MTNLDDFQNLFSKEIINIKPLHVEYVNDIININGNRLDKSQKKTEENALIPLYLLQEINIIAYTLHCLDQKGITSSNYSEKVKQYKDLCTKLFEEFGVAFKTEGKDANHVIPFSNPAELYKKIDTLLTFHKIKNNIKRNFYIEFLNRERLPRQNKTTELERQQHKESCIKDIIVSDFQRLYVDLPSDQQFAILNSDYNYQYSEKYYDTMEKWGLKVIPENVMTFLLAFDLDEYNKIKQEQDNHEKYIKETISKHNFLSYPSCLCTETEFLTERLHFNMCPEAFPF